jgi:hypothetical protein
VSLLVVSATRNLEALVVVVAQKVCCTSPSSEPHELLVLLELGVVVAVVLPFVAFSLPPLASLAVLASCAARSTLVMAPTSVISVDGR